MKVEEVREAVKFAREYAATNGPMLMEMQTYRYYGHSMSDPGTSYRTREEVKSMQDQYDAIKHFTDLCEEKGLISKEKIEVGFIFFIVVEYLFVNVFFLGLQEMRKAIYKDVDAQLEQAKKDEWPALSEISTHLYVKRLEETRGMVPWHKV